MLIKVYLQREDVRVFVLGCTKLPFLSALGYMRLQHGLGITLLPSFGGHYKLWSRIYMQHEMTGFIVKPIPIAN